MPGNAGGNANCGNCGSANPGNVGNSGSSGSFGSGMPGSGGGNENCGSWNEHALTVHGAQSTLVEPTAAMPVGPMQTLLTPCTSGVDGASMPSVTRPVLHSVSGPPM